MSLKTTAAMCVAAALAAPTDALSVSCAAGQHAVQGACTPCGPGKFAEAGIGKTCQPCAANTWSAAEATAICTACGVGLTSPEGSDEEDDCVSSVSCAAGQHAVQGACTPCGPGKFAEAGIGKTCQPCAANTWSAAEATAICTACGVGLTSPEGSDEEDDCVSEPAGNGTGEPAGNGTGEPAGNGTGENQSRVDEGKASGDLGTVFGILGGVAGLLLLGALGLIFFMRGRADRSKQTQGDESHASGEGKQQAPESRPPPVVVVPALEPQNTLCDL